PRRTVRLRLTLVYVGLFVVSGAGLLAINLAALGFSQTSVSRAAVAAPASNSADASGAGQPSIQSQPDQSTTGSGVEINRAGAVIAAAIALGIMTVVSIALSWIVAGRVLRPLRTMTATTKLISEHRLLEGLLTLARAQHGALPDQAAVSLRPVVSAALDARGDAIARMDIEVELALRDVRVDGSEPLLSQMVENVVDNAVRHNERGGWIHVETGMDGAAASLVVETGGPMLDESKVQE